MRKALATLAVLVLTTLVVGSPLVACPFLAGQPACCRKSASHPPKCPLAPSLERCPFYLTEAKIGIPESGSEQILWAILPSAEPAAPVTWTATIHLPVDRLPDDPGTYLLHRVLRL